MQHTNQMTMATFVRKHSPPRTTVDMVLRISTSSCCMAYLHGQLRRLLFQRRLLPLHDDPEQLRLQSELLHAEVHHRGFRRHLHNAVEAEKRQMGS